MWILFTGENLRAVRFKSSYVFLKHPPHSTSDTILVPYMAAVGAASYFCNMVPMMATNSGQTYGSIKGEGQH